MIFIFGFKTLARWFSNLLAKFRKTDEDEAPNTETEPEKTENEEK